MAWNRPSEGAPKPKPKKPSALRGIAAGLVVVAVAGACVFMFMGKGEKPVEKQAEKERGRIKKAAPAPAPKANPVERITKPKTADEVMQNLETLPKPEIKKCELTPQEWERITNRVFETSMEQMLSLVFSTTPGDMPLPMPSISDTDKKNIAAILITRSKVKESDSEMTAFCKEQVNLAKKEMARYIGEGGDPDEFVQYYQQQLRHDFEMRCDAERQIHEVWAEDPSLARELCREVNKRFESRGIRPISEEKFVDFPE